MKISSVRHLTYEGFKNIWDNRLMSIASIGVLVSCMTLIGAAMLVSFNVNKAMADVEKENVIMAYLNDYNSVRYSEKYVVSSKEIKVPESDYLVHSEEEGRAVCDEIKRLKNVATVEYVSPDEGIDNIVGLMSEDKAKYIKQLRENGENPLPAAAKITLKDVSKFTKSVEQIKQVDGVYHVNSAEDVAKKVTSIKNAISTASYIIIIVLMIIAFVIVCNTIRVTMFSRKLEISIMKAVGATDAFIRLPFIVEGIIIGLIAAGFTLALLYFGYSAVIRTMAENLPNPVPFVAHIKEFALIFAGVGVASGLIGSIFMINKYLRKEGSEFSALA